MRPRLDRSRRVLSLVPVRGIALLFGVAACGEDTPADGESDRPRLEAGGDAPADRVPDAGAPEGDAEAGTAPGLDAADVGAPDPDAVSEEPPRWLHDTGLYAGAGSEVLAEGVVEFRPRFELWSDGAKKRRWVSLPSGTQIDTSDMDHWSYPVGTKIWKEFELEGQRIETRLMQKNDEGFFGWLMIAYAWNEDGTGAEAVPDGVERALGTEHDIPSSQRCLDCHIGMPDRALGLTALQLSHDLGGLTLADLAGDGRLTDEPPASGYVPPGDDLDRQALGILHANCGSCHNPMGGAADRTPLDLWLPVAALETVEGTPTHRTTVGVTVASTADWSDAEHVLVPGVPADSMLYVRMNRRSEGAMPPLATKVVDTAAVEIIGSWIERLGEE